MTREIILLLILVSSACVNSIYSKSAGDTTVSFKYYDYDVKIKSTPDNYFTGNLTITKNGVNQFVMDSSFTDYLEHSMVDLNGDGSNELVLSLSEGASPYIFNMLYIFDFKKGVKPLFMVQNAEVLTADKKPLLLVNSRLSPSVLGLWYSWYIEYKGGKLSYVKPDEKMKINLKPDYSFVNETLKDLKNENMICDDFAYNVFFEYIFICSKITGEESEAEDFFNKNYSCEEKVKALKECKSSASGTYSWIRDEDNYLYSEF